jgi:hypothetical protein
MKQILHLAVPQTPQNCENCCVDNNFHLSDGLKNKAARYFKPWHSNIRDWKIIQFPADVWKLSYSLKSEEGPSTVVSIYWNKGFPHYSIPVQCDFKEYIWLFLFVINKKRFW